MHIGKKAIAAGLAIALSMGICISPAFAVTQSDLDAAQAKLSSLADGLEPLEQQLTDQEASLNETASAISDKQAEIDDTTQKLSAARDTLSARMRANYKSGGTSLLSVIFGSSSAEDLVSNIYYADKISDQDAQTIETVKDLEDQLNSEKNELEQQQDEQQQTLSDTQSQAQEYQAKVAEAQAYYDSLDSELQQEIAVQAADNASSSAATVTQAIQTVAPSTTATATDDTDDDTSTGGGTSNSYTGSSSSTSSSSNSNSSSSESSSGSSSSSSSGGNAIEGGGLSAAYAARGSRYVWGATGPDTFDCSGLVCYCYGYARGRTTYEMIASLQASGDWKTSLSELSVGDLVFPSSGHVGIYIGNGQMIHAPHPGAKVCIGSVYSFIGGGTY